MKETIKEILTGAVLALDVWALYMVLTCVL